MATSKIVYDTHYADNRELLVAKLKTIPGNIRDPFAMMRYLSTNPHLEKVISPNLPDRFTPLCTLSVWCKTFGLDFQSRSRCPVPAQDGGGCGHLQGDHPGPDDLRGVAMQPNPKVPGHKLILTRHEQVSLRAASLYTADCECGKFHFIWADRLTAVRTAHWRHLFAVTHPLIEAAPAPVAVEA